MKQKLVQTLLVLSSLILCITLASCSKGPGKQAYIGAWKNLKTGNTMTITDNGNGNNLAVADDNGQKFTATLDSNGDLQTSIMVKMSILKQTGHLVWINGEYEKAGKK